MKSSKASWRNIVKNFRSWHKYPLPEIYGKPSPESAAGVRLFLISPSWLPPFGSCFSGSSPIAAFRLLLFRFLPIAAFRLLLFRFLPHCRLSAPALPVPLPLPPFGSCSSGSSPLPPFGSCFSGSSPIAAFRLLLFRHLHPDCIFSDPYITVAALGASVSCFMYLLRSHSYEFPHLCKAADTVAARGRNAA